MLADSGRFDVHSHLLPGVDDGCKTLEDSLACARLLVEQGYTRSFCTPHIWPSYPHNTVDGIPRRVATLQEAIDRAHIPLKLYPGGEINLSAAYLTIPREQVVSYNMAGRYVIFDIWSQTLPEFFEPAVKRLQSFGLTVILAHPERMEAVRNEPVLVDYFDELGLKLQGNLYCFVDSPLSSRRTTELAVRFLREGRYFLLGSDLHNPESLHYRIEGLNHAESIVGKEQLDRLTLHHPLLLLDE